MTKWRWKNKKNKREDGHMCTYNLFTHLPTISARKKKKNQKDGRPDRFTDSYRLFLYQKEKEKKFLFTMRSFISPAALTVNTQ